MKCSIDNRALLLGACAFPACSSLGSGEGYGFSDYSAVNVHRVRVGNGNMSVVPPRPWNRHRAILFEDIPAVEDWTLNGPLLDGITFITGLRSGQFMVRQRRTADQQVPKFRSDMTPPEIAAMLESLYRVRGGAVDFRTLSIQPQAVPRDQRLPVRLRASRRRRAVAEGPGRRRGRRRRALPRHVRRRAVALLRRRAARLRGDRRFGPVRANGLSSSDGRDRPRRGVGPRRRRRGHVDVG